MANTTADQQTDLQAESPMDYAEHNRTYRGFVTGIKWAIGVSAVSMIILYFLIQP